MVMSNSHYCLTEPMEINLYRARQIIDLCSNLTASIDDEAFISMKASQLGCLMDVLRDLIPQSGEMEYRVERNEAA